MDSLGIRKHIEDWLRNNEGRANSMAFKIQKITDEYLEFCIEVKVLQLTLPPNFYTSCSADGIISNPNCPFIGTLTEAKWDEPMDIDPEAMETDPELLTVLNEKLDKLSNSGYYSFSSVLDSIIDTFEKYKYCSDCDGEIDEEDARRSAGEGYTPFRSVQSQGSLKKGYFEQLIEDANKKCNGARAAAMSSRTENIRDGILRWCKVYSPSHSKWFVGFHSKWRVVFEIELSGILPEYYRHRHGHVFEELGFSFATPLRIEVMFEPLGRSSKGASLETLGESLGGAFRGLSDRHDPGDVTKPNPRPWMAKDFFMFVRFLKCTGSRVVKLSNPRHLYGLRSLLPRMAKDFFSQLKRDRDDDNNALFTWDANIFVNFLLFTGSRLASLLNRCIICDKELPFTVSRLCSCADKLCLLGYKELRLGGQVLQEVIRMPLELIDLEISLALASAEGDRDMFEPFPPFPLGNCSPLLDTSTLKNIIKSFPPVSEMRLCGDEVNLKAKLAKSYLCTPYGKLLKKLGNKYFGTDVSKIPYKVLRFILNSNRLCLVFLSENDDKVLKVDNSHSQFYQFAVVQDSPEREAMYIEYYRNEREVSRFGFHGSSRENWYSILRNGLRCFSNTNLMSAGNSHGDGIYLADKFEHSELYSDSGPRSPWRNGMYVNGLQVVSICEAISSKTKEYSFGGGICVVPREDEGSVAVRYLLVFPPHTDNHLRAKISHGHILSHGGYSVDLSQHYKSIRQKYASGSLSH